jgi:hypothetical protein
MSDIVIKQVVGIGCNNNGIPPPPRAEGLMLAASTPTDCHNQSSASARRFKALLVLLCILAGSQTARAREVLLQDDGFLVLHDFSNIVISEEQASTVRAFVEVGSLAENSVSETDLKAIFKTATHLLENKVRLVSEKQQANLLVVTRVYQTINPGYRNSKHEPTHGLILIGVCNYPIRATERDCDNLMLYYFADHRTDDIFQIAFDMWLRRAFPKSAN